ncbi:hypothetical protein [Nonomuraea rubra]|uniref:Uncharacterized protein n=1 Tax=Nonomuraea rubra TaxID=46180 RepID=A0A7X0TZW2_9ACTN|nr:hypothetical protein [Nonomuraea rubra]MBB6549928.1 hypothetical protein [Nonomuraea rubra]
MAALLRARVPQPLIDPGRRAPMCAEAARHPGLSSLHQYEPDCDSTWPNRPGATNAA